MNQKTTADQIAGTTARLFELQPLPGDPLKMDFDALYPAASVEEYAGWRPQVGVTTATMPPDNVTQRGRSVGSSVKEKKVSKWLPKTEIDVFAMSPDEILGRGRSVEATPKEEKRRKSKSQKRSHTPAEKPRNKLVKKKLKDIFVSRDKPPKESRPSSDCCPKCKDLPAVPRREVQQVGQQEAVELEADTFSSIQTPAEFMMGPEDSMSALVALTGSGTISRTTSRSSRYSQRSKDTTSSSSYSGSRAPSIYTRAVTALPYSTQHFLDSIDDNAPKPPVPLKIRPASRSPVLHREASDANLRLIESYERPREWDMGWDEDFDDMLNQLQQDAIEDEKVRAAVKMVMDEGPVMNRPRPPRIKPARSRWSDMSSVSPLSTSSESSDIAPYYTGKSREVSLLSTTSPALAQLPDLEPDVSNPSTPSTRASNTPYRANFPPLPYRANFPPLPPLPTSRKNSQRSHISQCLSTASSGQQSRRASQSVTDLNRTTSALRSNSASQSVTNLGRVSSSPYYSMRRNHSSTVIVPSSHLYKESERNTRYWSQPETPKQFDPYQLEVNPYAAVLDIHPAFREGYREEVRRAKPEHYGVHF